MTSCMLLPAVVEAILRVMVNVSFCNQFGHYRLDYPLLKKAEKELRRQQKHKRGETVAVAHTSSGEASEDEYDEELTYVTEVETVSAAGKVDREPWTCTMYCWIAVH